MLLGLEPHALDRVPPRPGHERYEVNSMSGLLAFRHHAFRNLHFQLVAQVLYHATGTGTELAALGINFYLKIYNGPVSCLGVCLCKDPVNQGGWCI